MKGAFERASKRRANSSNKPVKHELEKKAKNHEDKTNKDKCVKND